MAQEAFARIKEAELQALTMISDARENASQIIVRAEEDSADAYLRHADTFKRRALEKKRQAEIDARQDSEQAALETAELCAALKEKLSQQKQKAVEAVIRVVTE